MLYWWGVITIAPIIGRRRQVLRWLLDLYNPIHKAGSPTILPAAVDTANFTLPWFGRYAQDQIELPYHVHVLAGLRYDTAESIDPTGGPVKDSSDDQVSPRGGLV